MRSVRQARRGWTLLLVGLLVVLNGAVLTVLLTGAGPDGSGGALPTPRVAAPATSPGTIEAVAPEAVPADDEATTGPTPARLTTRALVVVDTDVAWRSTLASCGQGAAIVERTTDGGASWQRAEVELASAVRLRASDPSTAFLVGAAQECSTALVSTSDGGETWTRGDATLSSAWFLAPTDRTFVTGPGGSGPVPCPTGGVDLAALDAQRGLVLCQDGSLAASPDGGRTWETTAAVPGALALNLRDEGFVVATFEGACDGLSLHGVEADGQAQPAALACAPTGPASELAVAVQGDAIWVWSGAELLVSRDGGTTW